MKNLFVTCVLWTKKQMQYVRSLRMFSIIIVRVNCGYAPCTIALLRRDPMSDFFYTSFTLRGSTDQKCFYFLKVKKSKKFTLVSRNGWGSICNNKTTQGLSATKELQRVYLQLGDSTRGLSAINHMSICN